MRIINSLFLILIFLILFSSCKKNNNSSTPQEQTKQWSTIATFPGIGRANAISFVIGNKMYVGLGFGRKDNSDQDLSDFYEYNATTNAWIQKSDFPGGPREYAKAFSINGKAYVGMGQNVNCTLGGCTSITFHDLWEYDTLSDNWKNVGNINGLDDNTAVDGNLFVVSERVFIYFQHNLSELDTSSYSLIQRTSFPEYTEGMSFLSLNNKVYAVAGYYDAFTHYTNNVYRYDPFSNSWTKMKDFPGHIRTGAFNFSVNSKGYVAEGAYETQIPPNTSYQPAYLTDEWEYDPLADSWTRIVDFPIPVGGPVTGVIGNKAIVGTGYPEPRLTFDFNKEFRVY